MEEKNINYKEALEKYSKVITELKDLKRKLDLYKAGVQGALGDMSYMDTLTRLSKLRWMQNTTDKNIRKMYIDQNSGE